MTPGTQVGMDSCYRPIHVGDTIIDIDGRRYTIDELGRARTEGGKTFHLTEVLEIVVVREWKPKEAVVQTFTPNAKPKEYKFDFSDVPQDQRLPHRRHKDMTPEELAAYKKALSRRQCAKFRKSHREQLTAKQQRYRENYTAAQLEAERERGRRYYQRHRAERLAADKAYKERNKEKITAYQKAYYYANIDAIREKQRAYYLKNRERLIAKAKANHAKKQANKSK